MTKNEDDFVDMLIEMIEEEITDSLNLYLTDYVEVKTDKGYEDSIQDSGLAGGDDEMRDELFAASKGGKYLRGVLLATTAIEAAKFDEKDSGHRYMFLSAVVKISAALELFQTSMLVHDDIIDEDEERRGRPSSYLTLGPKRALLIGDLLLCAAEDTFYKGIVALSDALIINDLALDSIKCTWERMKRDVLIGQALDYELGNTKLDELSDEEIAALPGRAIQITMLKTASYTTVTPRKIGTIIGVGNVINDDDYDNFEDAMVKGIKFQLENDISGLRKDLQSGNISCALAAAFEGSSKSERERILKCIKQGGKITEKDLTWLQERILNVFG
jgi:geranylgeranyl diphosphate synthase type I